MGFLVRASRMTNFSTFRRVGFGRRVQESKDEEYTYDKVWAMDEVDGYDAW